MVDVKNTQHITLEMTVDRTGPDAGAKIIRALDAAENCLEQFGMRITGRRLAGGCMIFEAERVFCEQSALALCTELNERLLTLSPGDAKFVRCVISEGRK